MAVFSNNDVRAVFDVWEREGDACACNRAPFSACMQRVCTVFTRGITRARTDRWCHAIVCTSQCVCGWGRGRAATNGIPLGHFLTGSHCKLRPNTEGKNGEFVVRESASTPEAHIVVIKEGTEARCAFSTELSTRCCH